MATKNNQLTEKANTLMAAWDDKLSANFDTFFIGKPSLKRAFVDCVRRLALVNQDIVTKYTPMQVARALLEAAELGLLPDNNECAIVEVGGKPACWLMATGARKKILQVDGVKYYSVECIYENEKIVYDKLAGQLPIITMNEGCDFFNKGELCGAIAFAELTDGRIELVQISVAESAKYRPENKKGKYHYGDKWPEEFLRNIASKKLYKKLPKQDGMPADLWDSTDTGNSRPSTTQIAADIDAATIVSDDDGTPTTQPPADEAQAAQPATAADDTADDKEQTLKDV